MSDTSETPRKLMRQEKALQVVLLGTTVPLQEGGGIVFPNGVPGLGYHLDAWQFDRYRAGLERVMLGDAAVKRARLVVWIVLLTLLAGLIMLSAINFLEKAPFFKSHLDFWGPVIGIVLVLAVGFACVYFIHNQAMAFARDLLTNAPKVSRYALLYERFLGSLVAQGLRPVTLHLLAFIPFGLAVYIAWAMISSPRSLLGIVIAVLPLGAYAAWRFILLLLYWSFRRRHGRAPAPADLEPV